MGNDPRTALVDVNGTLYGTTQEGGANHFGTVFSITKSGRHRVLYSFGASKLDGVFPLAGLVAVDGILYGTTYGGGLAGAGSVFSITTSGLKKTIYFFKGGSDGYHPEAGLIDVNGVLYGTVIGGGSYGKGAIFSLTKSGAQRIVYSFRGTPDGSEPIASLLYLNGTLYGTTYIGGETNVGTVFAVTLSAAGNNSSERILHSFVGGSHDGAYPETGLTDVRGTLYGTTFEGGPGGNCSSCGTVFGITPAGTERVLHSFTGRPDGASPLADLINVDGVLYGTTFGGGKADSSCGALFKITTSGIETIVHSFDAKESCGPWGLLQENRHIFGTWAFPHHGAVYSLTI